MTFPSDAPDARVPVHVLTGFLGSGKTTLLNRLLRDASLSRTAVVVNELGAVGLDHLLVETSEDRLIQLAGGCLCCTVRGDLAATLIDLLERRARGRCPAFDRVIVETTGIADPVPILNLLVTDGALVERSRAGRIVTTVDAVNGHATLDRHPQSIRQAALADRLVVTKSDLAPRGAASLERRLERLNPSAPIVRAVDGVLPAGVDALLDGVRPMDAGDTAPAHARDHGHAHDAALTSFTLVREAPVAGVALALLVDALAQHLGADLLRVKGLVRLEESPDRPAVLHGAQHVFHPLDFLPAWPDSANRRTCLTFIVHGPSQRWVERIFDAIAWEVGDVAARLARRRARGAPAASTQPMRSPPCST